MSATVSKKKCPNAVASADQVRNRYLFCAWSWSDVRAIDRYKNIFLDSTWQRFVENSIGSLVTHDAINSQKLSHQILRQGSAFTTLFQIAGHEVVIRRRLER